MCKKDLIDEANNLIDKKKGELKFKGSLDHTGAVIKDRYLTAKENVVKSVRSAKNWILENPDLSEGIMLIGLGLSCFGYLFYLNKSIDLNPYYENFELENEEKKD